MSEKTEIEEFEESPSLDIDETVLDEARQDKVAAGTYPRRKSGVAGFLSFLALLLAAGGIAAGYYLYEKEIKPLKHLPKVVDQLRQGGASKEDVAELQNQIQIVSAGNDNLQSELVNAGGEYQSLQAGVAELRKNAGWGQREWSLAEVDFLLNMGRQQLQINRDPVSALAALNGAARRLDTIAAPDLAPLHQQIMLDIQSVESFNAPAADEVLAGLVTASTSLQPIPEPAPTVSTDSTATETPLREKGLSDIWNSFRDSLSGRVRVVKHEAPLNALTQQGVEAYKVDLLNLRIEALRLALLRHDSAAFKRELAGLSGWVEKTLPEKQSVTILAEVNSLQQLEFPPVPEIKATASDFIQADDSTGDASAEQASETVETVVEETAEVADPAVEAATEVTDVVVEEVPQEAETVAPVTETEMTTEEVPAESHSQETSESGEAPADTDADSQDESSQQEAHSSQPADTEAAPEQPAVESNTPATPGSAEIQELDRLLQQLDFQPEQGQGAPQ